jgi:hypothetical protein
LPHAIDRRVNAQLRLSGQLHVAGERLNTSVFEGVQVSTDVAGDLDGIPVAFLLGELQPLATTSGSSLEHPKYCITGSTLIETKGRHTRARAFF